MQGCEVVIHTASPFVVTNYKDVVKDIIEPAVKGTENVNYSVNRALNQSTCGADSQVLPQLMAMRWRFKIPRIMSLMKATGTIRVV